MSSPTIFPEANYALRGGPQSSFGGVSPVVNLFCYRGEGQIISCWRLSWRERFTALFRGRVWLQIQSPTTHPPVYVGFARPFETKK